MILRKRKKEERVVVMGRYMVSGIKLSLRKGEKRREERSASAREGRAKKGGTERRGETDLGDNGGPKFCDERKRKGSGRDSLNHKPPSLRIPWMGRQSASGLDFASSPPAASPVRRPRSIRRILCSLEIHMHYENQFLREIEERLLENRRQTMKRVRGFD
jgi:hypothetical protein